jgi:hypothetical protein
MSFLNNTEIFDRVHRVKKLLKKNGYYFPVFIDYGFGKSIPCARLYFKAPDLIISIYEDIYHIDTPSGYNYNTTNILELVEKFKTM